MALTTYNDEIDSGTDWTIAVLDTQSDGVATDLTGYTAAMHLRKAANSSTSLELTSGGGGIVITEASGRLDVTITAAQSARLSGAYLYALRVTSPAGIKDDLITGTLTFYPNLVR
jgi:hypothetical protein